MASPLDVHRELLERWRRAMDLVGPGPIEEHFLDAQGAIAGLQARGRWADLGSGAGFPGVALAAAFPEANVLLVERRQKRAAFLREVVAHAGLTNAEVVEADSESLESSSFDGIISRAYRPPAEYLRDALRLTRPGGTAVLLTAGDSPAPPAGLAVFHVEHYFVEGKPRASIRLRRQ